MAFWISAAWLLTNLLSLTALLLLVLYFYFSRNHKYWKSRGVPHIEPLPLVGNLWNLYTGRAPLGIELGNLYKKFDGPYFGIYVLDKPYLVLRDPNIIKNILIKNFSVFSNRNFGGDLQADPMAANSLFIMKNPDWRALRIQLTPVFTSGKMKMMMPLMNECGDSLHQYLQKASVDEVVEMKEVCSKYTTDLIASCAFGIKARCFEVENCEFRRAAGRMFHFNIKRAVELFSYFFAPKMVKLFKLKFMDNVSTKFFRSVFMDTIRHRTEQELKRNDFVDTLLSVRNNAAAGFKFDSDRMLSQAITFFTAGYETTSNLIAFTLYELCFHPDIQERLRLEIIEKIQSHDDIITYDAIQDMKYLNMVVSETLRKYPFGPFLNRHCDENYVIEETGLVIEKGISVIVPLIGLHHDPKYYSNPERFDPERFNDENKAKILPGTYMPFGDGPRYCIGDRFGLLSGKVGIIYVLKDFRVEKCPGTPDPLVLDPKSPFLIPAKGLPMKVVKI